MKELAVEQTNAEMRVNIGLYRVIMLYDIVVFTACFTAVAKKKKKLNAALNTVCRFK